MDLLKTLGVLALAALAAGCEFVREPTGLDLGADPVVVHSVLAAGSNRVSVFVVRVSDEGWTPGRTYEYEPGMEPVSGAEVTIGTPEGTVQLVERMEGMPACFRSYESYGEGAAPPAGGGCYGAVIPAGIRAGVEYTLSMRLPDGRLVRGAATPPPAARVVAPEARARFVLRAPGHGGPLAEVEARFEAPDRVAAVGLALQATTAFANGEAVPGATCGIYAERAVEPARTGRVTLPIHGFGCIRGDPGATRPFAADSVHARLLVTAYDSAFVRYQAAVGTRQATPGTAAQGITGALGLFAAESGISLPVTLVPAS